MSGSSETRDTKFVLPQFTADTADAIWRQAAAALAQAPQVQRQDSRSGYTRELLHCTFHLTDPRQRWVLSRQPALNPAFAIAEVVWILQGRDDAAFPKYWNPILPRFVGDSPELHGAYGQRLRQNFGIDQLERAYQALSENPDSRQVVLQIWDVTRDLPNPDGRARNPDIPCNISGMPKIRAGRLEWLQVMRSNDLFLGTPHNFVQFTVLQEVLAGWLGIEPGSYVQVSDSLHLYERNLGEMSVRQEPPQVYPAESLALPKDDFDRVLESIGAAMDSLRNPALTRTSFLSLVENPDLPTAWANFLRIVAADAARRRGWAEEAAMTGNSCSNAALVRAWAAWEQRTLARP